mmetsp:Transcript_26228/g.39043  ORF Transcript_26228/g.39043 Transcript_26228/m.39043 type:complete len:116 (-) Transcript_26228:326-673(-)|eukprot:CAMPEP_0116017452 /NCGR_PEP_ID=MMETSP0321-20121206/8056_1 /TAXON_ID=163516 /ORGANISM="Leptocylindrus danicus var. danicus, Strain B650" /LENGTH=115 /DNA_ID=CAMNT_0003487647 /DNA_START=125 /DNA_END=472 /DNA_ORIENTATION=-
MESKSSSSPSDGCSVDHIVLLKVKPDATEAEIQNLIDGAKSLVEVPGVISVSVGPTFVEEWMSDRRGGITHGISVRLQSKEALRSYQDHPLHVSVRDGIFKPLLTEAPIAVDWEL